MDGGGTANTSYPGDYSLTVRYLAPAVVALNGIPTAAVTGTPADSTIASANTRQTITITGEGFTSSTRVRFTAFNSDAPQNGLFDQEVTPTTIAPDGTSLTVVVPDNAVTGPVRVADQPAGLLLQIVPTISDVQHLSATYASGTTLRLNGGGFVEGDQTLVLGPDEVADLWNGQGPNAYNYLYPNTVVNGFANIDLPNDPAAGPIRVRTLGGTSAPYGVSFTGFGAGTVAARGTATVLALPSANAAQTITLLGSGFDATTQIVFQTRPQGPYQYSTADMPSTRLVNPVTVGAGGTTLTLIVPDDAMTGYVGVVGAGSVFLQIVPTIAQILLPASFATAQTVTIQGSGFIEDDVTVGIGTPVVKDTSSFDGINVYCRWAMPIGSHGMGRPAGGSTFPHYSRRPAVNWASAFTKTRMAMAR